MRSFVFMSKEARGDVEPLVEILFRNLAYPTTVRAEPFSALLRARQLY
jgi:hypothetical protein